MRNVFRRQFTAVVVIVVATTAVAAMATAPAFDLSGNWDLEFTFDDAAYSGGGIDCTFAHAGERLTGNCMTEALSGEVKEQRVTWQMKAGQTKETIAFSGTVSEAGTSIRGTFSMPNKGGRFIARKQGPAPAAALEPVAAIVDAFRTRQVVALTAGHGDGVGYSFGLSLVKDSRLAGVVDDIVVEEGSSRYQELADRYVAGDDISIEAIRAVWRETTQPGLGLDEPWEAFYRAVRDLNASRPRQRHIRVLLGDPPIEWENVKTPADHRRWIEMRDWFPADLIQREVIEKHRHALLFYGQMHFQRKNIGANYRSDGQAETIVSRLENTHHAHVFTIFTVMDVSTLQPDAASWPAPSLALVRGTILGAADFTFYYPSEAMGRFYLRDGKPDFAAGQIPRDEWKTLRAEDQFDAVLVTRARPVPVRSSPSRCADKPDIAERMRRATLTGIGVDALKRLCGL